MAYDRVTFLKSLSNDVFKAYDEAQWLSQYDALVAKTDMSAAEHYLADMAYSEVYSGYKASHGTKGIGELTPLLKKYETKDAPTSITIRRPQDWAQAGYYHKSGLDTHTLSRVWGLIQATPIGGIEQSIKTLSSEYPLTVAEKIMDAGAYYLAYMDREIKEGEKRLSQSEVFGMIRANDYDAGANVPGDRAKEKAREAYKASPCWPKGDSESPEAVYARVGTRGATWAPVSAATSVSDVSWAKVSADKIIIEINSVADFEKLVIEQSKTTPVIVDFYATWCGPCKTLGPALESAVKARDGAMVLAKVNVDVLKDIAGTYAVSGLPDVRGFVSGNYEPGMRGIPENPAELTPAINAMLDGVAARAATKLPKVSTSAAPSPATATSTAGNIVALTNAADFQLQVIERSKKTPVLVYAYNPTDKVEGNPPDSSSISFIAPLAEKVKAMNGNVALVTINWAQVKVDGLQSGTRQLVIYANGNSIPFTPPVGASVDGVMQAWVKAADAAK